MTCFGDRGATRSSYSPAPRSVESVINHRVINQKHVVAGVSGGVHVDPWTYVSGAAVQVDKYGALDAEQKAGAAPKQLPPGAWWWD